MSIPNFLLDENISPAIVKPLWAEGIDTIHIRDRGLLGVADHTVWERAMELARVVVTIDRDDFVRLALREKNHHGILALPSGGGRDEQLNHILTAVLLASTSSCVFANHCADIDITGDIFFSTCTSQQSNL